MPIPETLRPIQKAPSGLPGPSGTTGVVQLQATLALWPQTEDEVVESFILLLGDDREGRRGRLPVGPADRYRRCIEVPLVVGEKQHALRDVDHDPAPRRRYGNDMSIIDPKPLTDGQRRAKVQVILRGKGGSVDAEHGSDAGEAFGANDGVDRDPSAQTHRIGALGADAR